MANFNSQISDPHSPTWLLLGGLLFVGFGVLFLIGATVFQSRNWWSIFILLPALVLLIVTGLAYQASDGAFNFWVRLPLSLGLIVLTVATIFALNFSWGWAWTLMVIVPGLVIFLNGFTTPSLGWGDPVGGFINWLHWIGASVVLLGFIFLLNQLNLINLTALLGDTRWWAAIILLPGIGALINAWSVYRTNGPGAAAGYLLAIGLAYGFEAAAEFVNLPWQWRAPIVMIVVGMSVLVCGWGQK
jgi:hypothetical protein